MAKRDHGVYVVRDELGTARYVGYSLTELSTTVSKVESGNSGPAHLRSFVASGRAFEVDVLRMPTATDADVSRRKSCLLLQHGRVDLRTGTLWNEDDGEDGRRARPS